MALPERAALDACALIHWADPASPYASAMADWLRLGLQVGQVQIGGSTALLIEARGSGLAAPNEAAEQRIRNTLLDPRFILINVDRATSVLARELGVTHGLKTWDAVHLASALRFRADLLLTTDTKLLSLDGIDGLKVSTPFPPDGFNLFDQ